jgi:hypothetical protein
MQVLTESQMMTLSPTTAGVPADLPEPGNSVQWAVWGIVVGVGSVLLLCCCCCIFYKCCRRPAAEQRVGYGVDFRKLQALNNLEPIPRAGDASCRTHSAVGNSGFHFLVQHGPQVPTLRASAEERLPHTIFEYCAPAWALRSVSSTESIF